MEISYLSTAYFPPIEYVAYIIKSDKIIIDNNETYKKQTYRNRCHIYTENGLMPLSIPVSKPKGNYSKTKEILIFIAEDWKKNHWKSIETAYSSSPFFEFYGEEIKEVFFTDFERLADFNNSLLSVILDLLQIKNNISYSEDFIKPDTHSKDFRFSISPKIKSTVEFNDYIQVFDERYGFIENLSILDLIFNLGPESTYYLENLNLD